MMFETGRSNSSLMPLKGSRLRVIRRNEFINGLSNLVSRSKTGPSQRLSPEDAKPAFYLVKPRSMRGGVVEMDVGVTLQPIIPLGFVSVKIVQHYVDLFPRTASYHFVHEIQKLSPSAAGGLEVRYQPGGGRVVAAARQPHERHADHKHDVCLRNAHQNPTAATPQVPAITAKRGPARSLSQSAGICPMP